MSIDCGAAALNCEIPIRLDTYSGCSHQCKYCFNLRSRSNDNVKPSNCVQSLRNFIAGKRIRETKWCDWDIPLHWGGISDPFQPCEEKYGVSYECLKVFAETNYPFVASTKGRLIATDKYLDILKECNGVIQISMTSPLLDKLEPGVPPFNERLKMIEKIVPNCQRVIVRMQPYILEAKDDVLKELPVLSDLGVHGVVLEGIRVANKVKGLEWTGSDYAYPTHILEKHFEEIRDKAHEVGMKFYSGEPDLRSMGDDLCCCGVGDLYRTNKATSERYDQGLELEFSEAQLQKGTGGCFLSLGRKKSWLDICVKNSYAEMFYYLMERR